MSCKKLSLIMGVGSALVMSGVAGADGSESYQAEVGVSFEQSSYKDQEFDDKTNISIIGLNGTYYLQPINVGTHPLAEAAYFERAPSIDFIYEQATAKVTGSIFSFTYEQTNYAAQFNYASNASPFTGSIGVQSLRQNVDELDISESASIFQVTGGAYFGQGGRVLAGYAKLDSSDTTGSSFAVEAKYVAALNNNSAASVALEVFQGKQESDDGTTDSTGYEIAADYYITAATSFGFTRAWQKYKEETESSDSWEHRFRVKHFLSPKAAVAFEYMNSDYASDNRGIKIEAAIRI